MNQYKVFHVVRKKIINIKSITKKGEKPLHYNFSFKINLIHTAIRFGRF